MEIKIDKSRVKKYGSSIMNYSDTLESYIKRLEKIIESINTAWEGADALKYLNYMKNNYIRAINDAKDIIDNYGKYLNEIPNVYADLDEVFSSKSIDV